MKKRTLILSCTTLLLAGCATGYSERDFFGNGYTDVRIRPDSFLISFNANQFTHPDKVTQYALLRASELTLQNGYKYFTIVSTRDQTSTQTYTNISSDSTIKAGSHSKRRGSSKVLKESKQDRVTSGTIVRPGMGIQIQCYLEDPHLSDAIDAEFYWQANRPQ